MDLLVRTPHWSSMTRMLSALFLTLVVTTVTGHSEDAAEKALNEARDFAEAGDYAKALERHEWFHKNALSIRPSYYGVRLSFALGDWKRLGEKYPPALASLKAIRDAGAAALVAGKADRAMFHDVSSINQTLEEDGSTVALLKELHAKQPALAKKCFRFAQETLLAEGEIDLFVEYAGDLSIYMQTQIDRHQDLTGHLRSRKDPSMAASIKHFDDELVETALKLIQIATEKNDPATATKIREMTSKIIADPRLK
jgi:hypothetical protein